MHPRNRLSVIALTAAALIALAGCGGGSDAAAGGKSAVKFGLIAPLTGPLATAGSSFSAGVHKCVDETNSAGGANGHKVELTEIDDAYNPQRTLTAFRKLVQQDQADVVGSFGIDTAKAVLEYASSTGVPWMPFAALEGAYEPLKKSVFGFTPSDEIQGQKIAHYMVDKFKPKRVNIFYAQLEGQTANISALKKYFSEQGITVGFEDSYQLGTISNFGQVVQKLGSGNPDMIVLVTSTPDGSQIIKGLRADGVSVPVMGSSIFTDPLMIKLIGDSSKDVYAPATQEILGSDAVKDVSAKFDPKTLTGYTLAGYGWCQIYMKAIDNAGNGNDLSRDDIIKGFESIKDFDNGVHPPVTINSTDHLALGSLGISRNDGKEITLIQPFEPFTIPGT